MPRHPAIRLVVRLAIGLFVGGIVAVVGLVVWLVWFAPIADVRPDSIREAGDVSALRDEGGALLARAASAHGLAEWRRLETQTVEAVDRWAPGQQGWWPESEQRFRADRVLGTFTSRVRLDGGPADGEVWGIQDWRAWKLQPGWSEPEWLEDMAIEFYLPTLQYFDELPFRLLEAPIALAGGEGTYRERLHDRVFVTWGRVESHSEHDQYDVWIDQETGLVSAVRYTVRDAVDFADGLMRHAMRTFAIGTIHFDAYERIDGVAVPTVQTVTLAGPADTEFPIGEAYFHRLEVKRVAFDEVATSEILADRTTGSGSDAKPLP